MKSNLPYNVMRHRNTWDVAPRDPFTVGNMILAALNVQVSSLFVIYAVGYLATTAITSLALKALAPKLGAENKGTLFNVREPTAPQRYIYGQVRTGGVLTYIETTGTDNKYLHQVITLAGHPVEEIGDIYLNDEIFARANSSSYNYTVWADYTHTGRDGPYTALKNVTLNGCTTNYSVNDVLTQAQLDSLMIEAGYDYNEFDFIGGKIASKTTDIGVVYGDRWKNKIRINAHDGTQTEVDHDLFDETSIKYPNGDSTQTAYANYATCPFIGTGIPYLYVRYEYDQEVFSNGIPNITVVVKGKKVENTSGVAQTYPASGNAALVIRDYLKSEYGLDDTHVDDTYFAAAANDCNDDITLAAGGTEKRYLINGVVSAESNVGTTLQDMVAACNGTLYLSGGEWRLKVGVYEASQKSFTLDDLRSEITLPTRRSRRDNFNKVVGRFIYGGVYDATTNPDAGDWVGADYPAITSATFLSEDGNIENIADLQLNMVTSPSQAQRVAKQTLFRSREQLTFVAEFGLSAINLEVGDTVDLTIADYGWTNKEFEVASWALMIGETGGIRIRMTLRETSEAAFDWNAEETDIISNNSTLPQYWIVPAPDFDGAPVTQTVILPDGTTYSTATVSWFMTTPELIDHFIVSYNRTSGDSDAQQLIVRGTSLEIADAQIGEEYTVTVTAVSPLGIHSDTISWDVTIPQDTTPPSTPSITSVTGGYTQITVAWTNPSDADHKEIRVYANTTNNSDTATLVGTVSGSSFVHAGLPESSTRYYWTKAVDYTGNVSAFSTGVSGSTLANPADGTNGADGVNGDTIVTGRVYYQTLQASAPSTPSASSYNVATGTFTGLTAGWALTQPSVEITDTSVKEWSSQYQVTIDGTTSAQTISFTSPSGAIQVAADIESDNYVAGTSGWHIERDTGFAEFGSAAIRGALTANQIQIDGVTLDSDGSGNLIIKSGGVDTTQLAPSGVITSTIAARAATDATVSSASTLTLTTTGSTSLGSFTTTESNQFIIVQAGANAYGTGTGTSYSVALTIDGVATSLFLNSVNDSYATYNDLRFPIAVLDRRVIASAGSHTLGLSYVIGSGNTLELVNLDVVVTLLKR